MSDYEKNPWLVHLCYKILRGQPSALSLLAHNPFPDKPPTYLRAELYEYEFTQDRREDGAWWKRTRLGYVSGTTCGGRSQIN